MCLITDHKTPEILEEDLTVYKILRKSGSTIYQNFNYDFDIPYETNFSFIDKKDSYYWKYLDGKDNKAMCTTLKSNLDELRDSDRVICIAQGFHSALTKDRLRGLGKQGITKIFTCTIPKGATIYRGYTDLIVSNQIIIHKTNKIKS